MAIKKRGDGTGTTTKTAVKAAKPAGKPKIKTSHATTDTAPPRRRTARAGVEGGPRSARPTRGRLDPALKSQRPSNLRKAPLAPPKRAAGAARRASEPPRGTPEPSSKAREIAIAIAAEGIDKKALGIEILDVTGRVDYADFLVVMTGRSDRHVHAIATGLEEAMRKRKVAALSIEGLASATWVLIDFGDVVVHVFQEEARALYDIEGLWIEASRVPVPAELTGPEPLDLR